MFIRSCGVLGWLAVIVGAQTPAPPAPLPTLNSVMPAAATPPATAHPWYIKPENGQWMICVKSYTGEKAKLNAEALAQDIRERYKVAAYLFERGSAERAQEAARFQREKTRKQAESAGTEAQFQKLQEQLKQEALAKGMDFIESKPLVKTGTVLFEDQYAVLIGGWPTMEAARRELEKVRRWEAPSNTALMDTQYIVRGARGQKEGEFVHINPFQASMVTINPTAPRPADAEGDAETKFVHKLNADEEYSVLKIQKPWTIVVKNFTPPQDLRDKENKSFLVKLFSPNKDAMAAAGDQARSLAKSLRDMKPTKEFPYGPFESYVLHTRYGSMVCVGQFDAADDTKLLQIQNQLGLIKFNVGKQRDQIEQAGVRLFDRLYAMRVKQ